MNHELERNFHKFVKTAKTLTASRMNALSHLITPFYLNGCVVITCRVSEL